MYLTRGAFSRLGRISKWEKVSTFAPKNDLDDKELTVIGSFVGSSVVWVANEKLRYRVAQTILYKLVVEKKRRYHDHERRNYVMPAGINFNVRLGAKPRGFFDRFPISRRLKVSFSGPVSSRVLSSNLTRRVEIRTLGSANNYLVKAIEIFM